MSWRNAQSAFVLETPNEVSGLSMVEVPVTRKSVTG